MKNYDKDMLDGSDQTPESAYIQGKGAQYKKVLDHINEKYPKDQTIDLFELPLLVYFALKANIITQLLRNDCPEIMNPDFHFKGNRTEIFNYAMQKDKQHITPKPDLYISSSQLKLFTHFLIKLPISFVPRAEAVTDKHAYSKHAYSQECTAQADWFSKVKCLEVFIKTFDISSSEIPSMKHLAKYPFAAIYEYLYSAYDSIPHEIRTLFEKTLDGINTTLSDNITIHGDKKLELNQVIDPFPPQIYQKRIRKLRKYLNISQNYMIITQRTPTFLKL